MRSILPVVFGLLAACDSTEPRAPSPSVDAGTFDAASGPGAIPGCTTSTDCRVFEVACDGQCACRALAKSDPDPTCSEPLACFAPSCIGKTAACEDSACVLR